MLVIAGIGWAFATLNNSDGTAARDQGAISGPGAAPDSPGDTGAPPTKDAATSSPAQQTPPASTSPPANQTPAGVRGSDYVGAIEDTAEEELDSRGFDVKTQEVPGGTEGVVASVSPPGTLAPGAEVTLFVYTGETGGGDHDNAKDPGKSDQGKSDKAAKGGDPGKEQGKGDDDRGKGDDQGKGGDGKGRGRAEP